MEEKTEDIIGIGGEIHHGFAGYDKWSKTGILTEDRESTQAG